MKLLKYFDHKNNYCKIQMSSYTEVHTIQVGSKSWISRIKQNIKDLAWLICYFGQVSGLLLRSLKIKCNFSKNDGWNMNFAIILSDCIESWAWDPFWSTSASFWTGRHQNLNSTSFIVLYVAIANRDQAVIFYWNNSSGQLWMVYQMSFKNIICLRVKHY